MIERLVAACLRKRWLAVAAFILFCVFGYYSFTTLAIEAYPESPIPRLRSSPRHPGLAAEEVKSRSPFRWNAS